MTTNWREKAIDKLMLDQIHVPPHSFVTDIDILEHIKAEPTRISDSPRVAMWFLLYNAYIAMTDAELAAEILGSKTE